MAFINEYASLDDAKAYNLAGILGGFLRKDIPTDFKFAWTVDRDRQAFLIWAGADKDSFATRHTFLLRWANATISATLDKVGGSDLRADPVVSAWELVNIHLPPGQEHLKGEAIEILKEALTEFKVDGVKWPVKNHQAVFNF